MREDHHGQQAIDYINSQQGRPDGGSDGASRAGREGTPALTPIIEGVIACPPFKHAF